MPSKLFATGIVLVTIVSSSMVLAQAKTGVLAGTVMEGELPQPGLEVVLTDKNDKVQSKIKTNEKGMFEFKDLAAGTYKVTATKPVNARQGSAEIRIIRLERISFGAEPGFSI